MKKILLISALLSSSLLMASEKSTVVFVTLQAASGDSSHTRSNANNSASESTSISSYKLMVGSDVNLYGLGQTSRFYGSYKYSNVGGVDIDSSDTYAVGYVENMKYFSFFDRENKSIFPFAGYELGYIDSKNAEGLSSEIDLGLVYAFDDYEVSLAYTYTYIDWGEPAYNTSYYDHNNQVTMGLTYKFTSEGK